MVSRKNRHIWEFGDFQTPSSLAQTATNLVNRLGYNPQSVLEPSCGRGTFLIAAANEFPNALRFVGVEINEDHLDECQKQILKAPFGDRINLLHANFFCLDWEEIFSALPKPVLIIGNPPWVTSSELGTLGSRNLPQKSNFQQFSGIEAVTGKSNFDISEWMLHKHIEWLQFHEGIMAMLCKTSVARKVLARAWKHDQRIKTARIYQIDAVKHFRAAVDACFFVVDSVGKDNSSKECEVYESLDAQHPTQVIGYHDKTLISDVYKYMPYRHLRGLDENYVWRSGLKHDCSKVMELNLRKSGFYNGLDHKVDLEDTYVFPLYKGSDIANGRIYECKRRVIVTQRKVGEDTCHIAQDAPRTWKYLHQHKVFFDKRKSSIYKNRPLFSIFGVGNYTFKPWKIAISGLYKKLEFKIIAPVADRPVMFDDTIYFLACDTKEETHFLSDLLNSPPAREFLESMIFWSEKRPITIDLLKRLNIRVLARELERESDYERFASARISNWKSKKYKSMLV